jgi:hypothetical protein
MNEQGNIGAALAAPFPADAIGWKAQSTNGSSALAVAYIDARDVMDRLDAVVGPANWQDAYTVLSDGNVLCRLSLRLGGEWIGKEDVGGESDQRDEGDKRKASFSDALKRAAVKWGVGRYLYRLPAQWVDYDPQRKQLKGTPALPSWALPQPATKQKARPAPANGTAVKPQDGAELFQRLKDYEAKLVKEGVCQPGKLLEHVRTKGVAVGYVPEIVRWPAAAYNFCVTEIKTFEADCRKGEGPVSAGTECVISGQTGKAP